MSLFSECYNPHVRYRTASAVGISCAGTCLRESISLLVPLTLDVGDYLLGVVPWFPWPWSGFRLLKLWILSLEHSGNICIYHLLCVLLFYLAKWLKFLKDYVGEFKYMYVFDIMWLHQFSVSGLYRMLLLLEVYISYGRVSWIACLLRTGCLVEDVLLTLHVSSAKLLVSQDNTFSLNTITQLLCGILCCTRWSVKELMLVLLQKVVMSNCQPDVSKEIYLGWTFSCYVCWICLLYLDS